MNLLHPEPLPHGCHSVSGDCQEPPATSYELSDYISIFPPPWFDAPPESSTEFFPVFVRVSMALQAELRRLLPQLFLSDLDKFEDVHMVYPLLVYGASRPFPGEPRTDFTYDILNREMMKMFYFSARNDLPAMLASVWKRLRAAGLREIAVNYRPDRSKRIIMSVQRLKKERRRLNHILTMETRMVNDLIGFAGINALRPFKRELVARRIRKALLMRLRRIYAKHDFSALVQEIIQTVTPALTAPIQPEGRKPRARRLQWRVPASMQELLR